MSDGQAWVCRMWNETVDTSEKIHAENLCASLRSVESEYS
jgi:hypothetical protein